MNIQWYPGHMTKTRRQIEADLGQVEMVAEIIDARIPVASRTPAGATSGADRKMACQGIGGAACPGYGGGGSQCGEIHLY